MRPDLLERARQATLDVYERQAAGWDRHRPRGLCERAWLERWLARLPPQPRVLDLGCGAGDPITAYLVERGVQYVGLDAAPAMLAIARRRWPGLTLLQRDMRDLTGLAGFDGVLSWDGSFHLDAAAQRRLIEALGRCVGDRGAVLLTIGDRAGEVLGGVEGEAVYHASLAAEDYREAFLTAGFGEVEIALRDPACGERSLCLAVRPAE